MTENAEERPDANPAGLIDMLETAQEGGLKLDTIIAYAVAGADLVTETLREVVMEGGFSVDVAGELLDGRPPPFTRTLDAAIPGENIVLAVYSNRRGRWAAVQRDSDGTEYVAWGTTEALARRAAALRGVREKTPPPARESAPAPKNIARVDVVPERGPERQQPRAVEEPAEKFEAGSDWKIRF